MRNGAGDSSAAPEIEDLGSYLAAPGRVATMRAEPVSVRDVRVAQQRLLHEVQVLARRIGDTLPVDPVVLLPVHSSAVVITRMIRIPATDSAAALHAWHARVGGVVKLGSARAQVGPWRRDARTADGYRCNATVTGMRTIGPVSVEVTVAPWARTATQLDLRPPRRFRATRRYFGAGHDLLDVMIKEIARADER